MRVSWLWRGVYLELGWLVALVAVGDALLMLDWFWFFQPLERSSRRSGFSHAVDLTVCAVFYASFFAPLPAGDWMYFGSLVGKPRRCGQLIGVRLPSPVDWAMCVSY